MPIETAKDLRDHIELAIQVELSTVPPYLYAMYSIADRQSEAALLIRSIVAEEMLHAVLVTNLLLAVGGEPRFSEYVPSYPGLLPHHEPPLELSLTPCSADVIRDVFMRIEQPEVHGAPLDPDRFESLGQFYHALEVSIEELAVAGALFADPQAVRQLSDPSFYSPVQYDAEDSGGLSLIKDPASARDAIEVIIHQGEGLSTERWADPLHQELTHYHKLVQIAEGQSPLGEVIPLAVSPRAAEYAGPVRQVAELFNGAYMALFLIMDDLFSPAVDKRPGVGRLYRVMVDVMSPLAYFLVGQPLQDGLFAGPTFERYEFGSSDWMAELSSMASDAAGSFEELSGVAEAVAAL